MIMDSKGSSFLKICARNIARALIVAGFLLCAFKGWAQLSPGGGKFAPTNMPPMSWSFHDNTNRTTRGGYLIPPRVEVFHGGLLNDYHMNKENAYE